LKDWDHVQWKKTVTVEDFEDYYSDISPSIIKDDYFDSIVRNSWKYQKLNKTIGGTKTFF